MTEVDVAFAKASAQGLTHNSGVQELMVTEGWEHTHPRVWCPPSRRILSPAWRNSEKKNRRYVAQVTSLGCAALSSTPLCGCRCVGRRNVRCDANMSVKVSTQRGFDEFSDPGSGAVLSD